MVSTKSLTLAAAALMVAGANAQLAHVCTHGDYGAISEQVFSLSGAAPGAKVEYEGTRGEAKAKGTATVNDDGHFFVSFDSGTTGSHEDAAITLTANGETIKSTSTGQNPCITVSLDCPAAGAAATVDSKITDSYNWQDVFQGSGSFDVAAGTSAQFSPLFTDPLLYYVDVISARSLADTDYFCSSGQQASPTNPEQRKTNPRFNAVTHLCTHGDYGTTIEEIFEVAGTAEGDVLAWSGTRGDATGKGNVKVNADGQVALVFTVGDTNASIEGGALKVTIGDQEFTGNSDPAGKPCLTITADCTPTGSVTVSSDFVTRDFTWASQFESGAFSLEKGGTVSFAATQLPTFWFIDIVAGAADTDYFCGSGQQTNLGSHEDMAADKAQYTAAAAAAASCSEGAAALSSGAIAGIVAGGLAVGGAAAYAGYRAGANRAAQFSEDKANIQNTV